MSSSCVRIYIFFNNAVSFIDYVYMYLHELSFFFKNNFETELAGFLAKQNHFFPPPI